MRRKLGAAEGAMLVFGDHYPNHFAMTAQIKGEISVQKVRSALIKVQERRPFLAARLVTTDDGTWYETEGTDEIPIGTLTGTWTDWIAEELPRPFGGKTAPRFGVLLGFHDDFTDLMLISDHGIADGLAAAYLLRDLLHYLAYPDEIVVPLEEALPLEDVLPPVDLPQTQQESQPPSNPPDPPAKSETLMPRSLFVVAWSLNAVQTQALINCCREHEVTVHSALCTAFLNAFARLDPNGSTLRSVSSPINLRDRLTQPVGEQIGMYINVGVRTSLNCVPERDFWEMAREVKTLLLTATRDENLFPAIRQFHEMIRSMPTVNPSFDFLDAPPERAPYDLSISNLGRLDFSANYGALELCGVYGPVLNSLFDETIVGVATAGGVMTFSLVSRPNLMSRSTAETIRDQVNCLLTAIIGQE